MLDRTPHLIGQRSAKGRGSPNLFVMANKKKIRDASIQPRQPLCELVVIADACANYARLGRCKPDDGHLAPDRGAPEGAGRDCHRLSMLSAHRTNA